MIHRPTGLTSYADGRSQAANKEEAASILSAKVEQRQKNAEEEKYNASRKNQVGNRQRSDKIRTYNFKKRRVVDHRLETKTTRIDEVMNGRFDLLGIGLVPGQDQEFVQVEWIRYVILHQACFGCFVQDVDPQWTYLRCAVELHRVPVIESVWSNFNKIKIADKQGESNATQ